MNDENILVTLILCVRIYLLDISEEYRHTQSTEMVGTP